MIKIYIPNNNIQERTYILNIIFRDFLALNFIIIQSNDPNYKIVISNNNDIVIEDHFFGKFPLPLTYLRKDSIPPQIYTTCSIFSSDLKIPVIYGNKNISVSDGSIHCGIDIFATCFFMLTRWEEYVSKEKDQFNRFPETESLSYKQNFLTSPIVNQYLEMIWNMLIHIGYRGKRKIETYRIIPTHDIDRIYDKTLMKWILFLIKSGDFKRTGIGLYYKLLKINQLESFQYILNISEKHNVKSHFYFISGGSYKYEKYYEIFDPIVTEIITLIKRNNHIIGIHPSFNTFNDNSMWIKEKKNLESCLDDQLTEGRQHYLCFTNPFTWRIWEENNMKYDSTMGLSKNFGFRCGTGNEYHLFDILKRSELKIKERPLIVMDTAISKKLNKENAFKEILLCKNLCKKFNMPFTVLFHNHLFDNTFWNFTKEFYEELLRW